MCRKIWRVEKVEFLQKPIWLAKLRARQADFRYN